MIVLWTAVVALAIGLGIGVALGRRTRGPDPSLALEGWFEAHAAELRRLGDAARVRDGSDDRLRAEVVDIDLGAAPRASSPGAG